MKTRTKLIVLALLFLVFLLAIPLLKNPFDSSGALVSMVDNQVRDGSVGLEKTYQKSNSKIKGLWNNYLNLVSIRKKYEKSQQELALAQLQIQVLQEQLYWSGQNKKFLKRFDWLKNKSLAAQVVSYDPFLGAFVLRIDRGQQDMVSLNDPVVDARGLVGRVIRVADRSAEVLLLTHSQFAVDSLNQTSRVRALVMGAGDELDFKRMPFLAKFEFFRLEGQIEDGDLFVTSGLLGMYPKGIPVGFVYDLKRDENGVIQKAKLMPASDLAKLEYVWVIRMQLN